MMSTCKPLLVALLLLELDVHVQAAAPQLRDEVQSCSDFDEVSPTVCWCSSDVLGRSTELGEGRHFFEDGFVSAGPGV